MKVATFRWGGRRTVGVVSQDGAEITPLAGDARTQAIGALALIEDMVAGKPQPPAAGPRLPVSAVELEAPLPRPRRNLFCVGRNYRSHARELASTVFADIAKKEVEWPIIFTKFPESVIGPRAPIVLPKGITEQTDYEAELAVVIGRAAADIPRRARDRARVRLHDRQRRHGARRAEAAQAVAARQVARHVRPDGPMARRRRRARRPRHARALLDQRRAAPGRVDARSDLRHPGADRIRSRAASRCIPAT